MPRLSCCTLALTTVSACNKFAIDEECMSLVFVKHLAKHVGKNRLMKADAVMTQAKCHLDGYANHGTSTVVNLSALQPNSGGRS